MKRDRMTISSLPARYLQTPSTTVAKMVPLLHVRVANPTASVQDAPA